MKITIPESLRSITGPLLLTGHTGFKGSWMGLLLDSIGVEWVGISLPPEPDSLYSLLGQRNYTKEYFVDIRDYNQLNKIVKEVKPSFVIHLAAQPLVLDSYEQPRQTFETNVLGTVNLLDSLKDTGPNTRVVAATTDKVYRAKTLNISYKETDPWGGKDPYSWSKVGAEAAISAWQQISSTQGGPKLFSARSGNVIGGGDRSKNRLLPDLVTGFISKSKIEIRNQNSTRPWQHVLDPLLGYLLVLSYNGFESAFNFSPGVKSLKVEKVVEIASKAWGEPVKINYLKHQDKFETKSLSLNSNLAKKSLGWTSKWTQEESVISTINWWKRVTSMSMTPKECCIADIQELFID